MTYTYKTRGTCSTQIDLELEGNIVHNVKFTGGCNGNLQAIPKLVEGLTVEQVEGRKSAASPATDARLPAAISWLKACRGSLRGHPSRRKGNTCKRKTRLSWDRRIILWTKLQE